MRRTGPNGQTSRKDEATLRALNFLRKYGLETALADAELQDGPLDDEEEMAYLALYDAARRGEW